jgi:K+-sensing histidine kinase KdpD
MPKSWSLIKPVIMSLIAVALTTAILIAIDAQLQPRHLMIGYLLPVTLIAMRYGSISAVLTATASGLAAAYFLLPPKYTFQIHPGLHAAELGMFMMLALIAAKTTAMLTYDRKDRDDK